MIATHNPGKLAEMRELLAPHGVEAVSAGELALREPEETGQTFRANAAIKAIAAAEAAQLPAFADDSGLVVEALNKLGNSVTRAGLLSIIRDVGVFDLDGITLSYGPDDNQGMDKVYLTVIQTDGSFKAVDQLERTTPTRSDCSCPPRTMPSIDTKSPELPAGADVLSHGTSRRNDR